MPRRLAIAAFAIGVAVAMALAPPAAAGPRLAPSEVIPPAELEAFVDGAVRQAMAERHIAGVTVSVVQNGAVALKKGYGFASLAPWRPVDPDLTLFRLGSISKTFTWLLVLKQVEAGHMRLDAPVNLYLPEALRIPDQGFRLPVRVRDLMNHTPGFEDRVLGQLIEREYARVRPLDVYLREERPRRVREPESLVSYSNYGAGLAGAAVSEVTGKPFEALVEADITGPLGLARTTFREPHPARAGMPAPLDPALAADLADGYRWTPAGWRRRPFEYVEQIAPAEGLSSTAADMALYMRLFLSSGTVGGVQVYGPATAAAFATPLPRPAPGVSAFRGGLEDQPLPGGLAALGHEGSTLSFFSNMTLVPALGLGIFVAANTDTGAALADALPRLIVGRFYAPSPGPPPTGSTALKDDKAAYEGVYLTDRRAYGGLEGFLDRLEGAVTVKVTDDGRLTVTGAGETRRWSPVGSLAAGQFVGDDGVERIVFRPAGHGARIFFHSGGAAAFERVGPAGQRAALVFLTSLAALASLAALGDLLSRARRGFRESLGQHRAGLFQTTQAALWLVAISLAGIWLTADHDPAVLLYDWPPPSLLIASTCALLASTMAILTLGLMPAVWRGGRRLDSWNAARKTRFTLTALIFLTYAILLASWGALEPWNA